MLVFWFYQDSVDELRRIFNKLNLIMDGEPAIRFIDPVWQEIANFIWDTDKDGFITKEEASVCKTIYFANYNNTSNIEILDLSALYITESPYKTILLTKVKQVIFGKVMSSPIIRSNAFKGNTSIEMVDTGDYYTTIEFGAFWNCTSLKNAILRENITDIGNRAFQGCTSMESCYIKATIPPILGTWAFDENNCTVYVPIGSGAAYKTATNWSAYAGRIIEYDFELSRKI